MVNKLKPQPVKSLVLTADNIFSTSAAVTVEPVQVTFDGQPAIVHVRTIDLVAREQWQQKLFEQKGKVSNSAAFVCVCACNADGSDMFGMDDYDTLKNANPDLINTIFLAGLKLNNMLPTSVDGLIKN